MKKLYRFQVLALLIIISIFVNGCETRKHHETHDPSLRLKESRYEALLTTSPKPSPRKRFVKKKAPRVVVPQEMKKFVSISASGLPVEDVLMELVKQTQVSLVMDPLLSGIVMIQAHKKPFIHVVRQICDMANLRYKIKSGILYIEPDTPYLKSYPLQFLNLMRQNESKISVATDVFSSMHYSKNGKHGAGNIDNGSNTLLKGQSKTNFWEELELNLSMILGETGQKSDASYTIHRQAGILTVKASQKTHDQVKTYLDLLTENTTAQVLIEAKIVEVTLKDEFKSGINWHSIRTDFNLNAPLGDIVVPGMFNPALAPVRDVISLGATGRNLTTIASLLSRFGTVRTLSNPRITVSNNQPAVLKVATNQVFFQVQYNRELGNDNRPETERASSLIQTVPIGLVMVVQPSINTQAGKITLNLRPTISRVTSFKEDPAVGVLTNNTRTSKIPEIQVRELDSVLNVTDGEVIVMGGLMEERSDNESSGVPDAKNIPLLGSFLKSKSDTRTVTELVILLRVSILNAPSDSVSTADERLYQNFTKDPRPLEMEGGRGNRDLL